MKKLLLIILCSTSSFAAVSVTSDREHFPNLFHAREIFQAATPSSESDLNYGAGIFEQRRCKVFSMTVNDDLQESAPLRISVGFQKYTPSAGDAPFVGIWKHSAFPSLPEGQVSFQPSGESRVEVFSGDSNGIIPFAFVRTTQDRTLVFEIIDLVRKQISIPSIADPDTLVDAYMICPVRR